MAITSQQKARRKSINLLFLRIIGPILSVFLFIVLNFEVALEPKSIRNVINILLVAFLLITVLLQSVSTARLFNTIMGLSLLLFVGFKFTNLVPNKYYVISVTELIVYSILGLLLVTIGNINRISNTSMSS